MTFFTSKQYSKLSFLMGKIWFTQKNICSQRTTTLCVVNSPPPLLSFSRVALRICCFAHALLTKQNRRKLLQALQIVNFDFYVTTNLFYRSILQNDREETQHDGNHDVGSAHLLLFCARNSSRLTSTIYQFQF